ncbi:hypothetical protein FS749_004559 [Ceratobasidium sp. UAMH 11750]|nr:hypothetical protein FS749_004559 [Ceratobasidium sp. UAMH 11750]
MMGRVRSPAAALQPASSIAPLGEVVGAADAIPALGFARAGPVPSTASRQAPPARASRSHTSNDLARDASYRPACGHLSANQTRPSRIQRLVAQARGSLQPYPPFSSRPPSPGGQPTQRHFRQPRTSSPGGSAKSG